MSTKKLRMELAGRLKKLRSHWNLTQKKMAERMNIGLSTYKYYEKGERDIPAIIFLSLLEFNVSATWLLSGLGEIDYLAANGAIDYIDATHAELIKQFIQKDLAKKCNEMMVKLEQLDPDELREVEDFLEYRLSKKTKIETAEQDWKEKKSGTQT